MAGSGACYISAGLGPGAMRLLMLSQDFPPHTGGIQTYALEIARRLAPRCDAFHLVVPGPADPRTDPGLDFPIHRVGRTTSGLVARGMAAALAVAQRYRLDTTFHSQWQTGAISLVGRRLGPIRRTFVAAHGRELLLDPWAGVPGGSALFAGLRRHVIRRADGLFPVSRFTGRLLTDLGVVPDRIHVVPNGTDPAHFVPTDGRAFRQRHGLGTHPLILTVGRLVPNKGIDTVIEALPKVLEEVPDALYVVAGTGPDRARLEAMATRLSVRSHLRFLGRIDDPELVSAYGAADVFVTLSRLEPPAVEGFGLVFLEAGACGTPVVGSRSGGIEDAVADGESGLLIPPRDPAAAATALSRVLSDRGFAARLGRAGRARVLASGTWDHAAARIWTAITGSHTGSDLASPPRPTRETDP